MHSKIVETLKNAHRMMEHVLTLIRLQADMLHPRTRSDEYAFLQKAIGYMHTYPGLIHYPAEEQIFVRLQNSTPETSQLCLRLTEQHIEFNNLETTLFGYINQAQKGDMGVHELIKKSANTYCMEQFDHITMEDKVLLPQAVALLTVDDWLDIGCKSNLAMDPLGDPDTLKHYDNLYDYIISTDPNLKAH